MVGSAPRVALYALFALSGFAGLIYESIWSHYLKLFLGHAAYAQTLVLMIFMGGMAIGSWLVGDLSRRVSRPLLWYVGVEAVLGVAALSFDKLFRLSQGWMFDAVLPSLDSGFAVDVAKWTFSVALTLPQAILLGATFPLISAGLLRLYPEIPGRALSWLYFTNSLGASIGVLASGYLLIGWVGLPGTIMAAGLVNFALAIGVYVLQRLDRVWAMTAAVQSGKVALGFRPNLMLMVAFVTGAASFMYEIGWIRMLSLVLGSATHSFELMLSAFILGLALGSFYIRGRIDREPNPLRLLGWLQVMMALLAVLSLPFYMFTFDAMAAALQALSPNEAGYFGFTFFSHLLCLALMLPVTFCAGMTLPLITAILLRSGQGEASIGRVYAANTLGAIVGVLVAVHVVMPLLGLRQVVLFGALLDAALGIWLLSRGWASLQPTSRWSLATAVALMLAIGLSVKLDTQKTASGVFRFGVADAYGRVVFHKDGKTASVDVVQRDEHTLSIATNGKVDASINHNQATEDDYTMVLAAAIPMSLHPEAKTAGVIGFGSGRTTHAFLTNPRLERVDTVEIEPAMVEGAKLYGDLVKRAYDDPRSRIFIEDAKTFFSRHRSKYDIIISEPSNPWVSGVSSLFSTEFYAQIKGYLQPKGLFVQWVQVYEIDLPLISSILNALDEEFEDYALYFTNRGDVLIVASPDRVVPSLITLVEAGDEFSALLDRLGIKTVDDLRQRLLGSRESLQPFFASLNEPPNSDYFPIVDQRAAKLRYMRASAIELSGIHPYSYRLDERMVPSNPTVQVRDLTFSEMLLDAGFIDRYYSGSAQGAVLSDMPQNVISLLMDLRLPPGCDALSIEKSWIPALKAVMHYFGPYLRPATGASIGRLVRNSSCYGFFNQEQRAWVDLLEAITARDWQRTLGITEQLLSVTPESGRDRNYLLAEMLLAEVKANGYPSAMNRAMGLDLPPLNDDIVLRYLRANIGV